ncbi:MAG: T9SS type A sorting domain-containing protein [Melioribacteraceae bacterium]|nr:T9SS type A sorting domain-containing protein [Melioribacteraceae bacterium]
MKKLLLILCLFTFLSADKLLAQDDWTYAYKISFPVEDSIVRPYLCDVDENGRLYITSSKAVGPAPINAIFYAEPDDTLFTKLIDYDRNGDSDTLTGNVGAIRGISTLGTDVFVSMNQPYPKYKPTTVAAMYRYINADTANVEQYGAYINFGGTGGYGSYIHGLAMSSDTIAFTGVAYGTSIRTYNWSHKYDGTDYASYIPPYPGAEWNVDNPTEPGGVHTDGADIIRDVALVPGDDYSTTTSRVFTSRNSLSIDQTTGGIALWQGGVQTEPFNYTPERIVDFDGYLSFMDQMPYGITVDKDELLWVAGTDSTRLWVKAFELDGVNAIEAYDLPSSNSKDFPVVDGAPMTGPADVALNKDATVAYVVDLWAKCAFVFKKGMVSVDDDQEVINKFKLEQNYPNPFNPTTKISFNLPKATNVKLVVTNVLGKEIATVINDRMSAGNHSKVFDASGLNSGVYFYSLITENLKVTKKMILVK